MYTPKSKFLVARVADCLKKSGEIDDDTARLVAVEFCLFNYPTLYTGGPPRRAAPPDDGLWIVPIELNSPIEGHMGVVGELRIDARSAAVVAHTDRAQVVAAGEKLWEGKDRANPFAAVPAGKARNVRPRLSANGPGAVRKRGLRKKS